MNVVDEWQTHMRDRDVTETDWSCPLSTFHRVVYKVVWKVVCDCKLIAITSSHKVVTSQKTPYVTIYMTKHHVQYFNCLFS